MQISAVQWTDQWWIDWSVSGPYKSITCSWATLASKRQFKSLESFKESLESGWGWRRWLFWIWQCKQNQHYVCACSLFSPGVYLWLMQGQARDSGSDLPTPECSEDRPIRTFLSRTQRHSRGSGLVIPWSFLEMEQTATPPQCLWLHDQTAQREHPVSSNLEQSSVRMIMAAGKGRRPQRSTGEIQRTEQLFILFTSSFASWTQAKLPSKSKLWYC